MLFAALAARFSVTLGRYYAGLWSYNFKRQLNWYQIDGSSFTAQTMPYRALTWSWTSVDGEVHYFDLPDLHKVKTTTFISVNVLTKDPNIPFGEIVGASLSVRAKMILIRTIQGGWSPIHGMEHEPPMAKYLSTYFQRIHSIERQSMIPVDWMHQSYDVGRHNPTILMCMLFSFVAATFRGQH